MTAIEGVGYETDPPPIRQSLTPTSLAWHFDINALAEQWEARATSAHTTNSQADTYSACAADLRNLARRHR